MASDDLGFEFFTSDTSIKVNPDLLYEDLLDETLARNTVLLIASKNKTISDLDLKIIKSRSYPYLNFSSGYSYSLNNYSSSLTKNQHTWGMNYSLTMGLTLFDGYNQKRNINNSFIALGNKELEYSKIEQGVKADLLSIYNAYQNYLRLTKLEEQNIQTASENLYIALERYKLGSLSGIDLREVQKSLLDAKESLLSINYQTKLAEVSLQLISSKIMDYYNKE
jgi:outer membrane protein TolC